jgi:hypothetical protein
MAIARRLEALYHDGQQELARYRVPAEDEAGGWDVDPEQYLEHDTAETDAAPAFYTEAPDLITRLVTALSGPMSVTDGTRA